MRGRKRGFAECVGEREGQKEEDEKRRARQLSQLEDRTQGCTACLAQRIPPQIDKTLLNRSFWRAACCGTLPEAHRSG
eukprot:358032-Chlamydomonas_euryale.AAC.3